MALKNNRSKHRFLTRILHYAEEIFRSRTVTTMGLRFPTNFSKKYENRYEYNLYDGVAGIGIVFLDLYKAIGQSRFADLCEEISHGLIQSTPQYQPMPAGLYNGFGGVALFHLACARILQKSESVEQAARLATRLGQSPPVDTDIIRGAAGAGLMQLALWYATRDPQFLNNARSAASFLGDTSLNMDVGVAWPVRDSRQPLSKNDRSYDDIATDVHTGLAHGAAGICIFLLELADITKDRQWIQLADEGFRWLDSKSLRMRSGLSWPRSETHRTIQNHWCHGSAGIGHAYLTRYRLTGEKRALQTAIAAGQATWDSLRFNPNESHCHCHGLSGAIDIFLELENHTGQMKWRKRAHSLGSRLNLKSSTTTEKAKDVSSTRGNGPGLSLGNAGVLRQLLRLHGSPVFPVLIPCRDPILLKSKSSWTVQHRATPAKYPMNLKPHESSVPPVGIRLNASKRYLVLGPPQPAIAERLVKRISKSSAGDEYFHALNKIDRSCDRIQRTYAHLIAPNALGPEVFGRLIREVAGIVLCDRADPETIRRSARHMIANAISAFELMLQRLESDTRGALAKEIGGRIKQIQILGSDPHRMGQRVIALQFEDGPRLLYKARPMAIDRELAGASYGDESPTLADLCRSWLRPSVKGGRLPTHRVITASPWHGYAEEIRAIAISALPPPQNILDPAESVRYFVPETARLKAGDDERYWFSAGLLAGHAFTLGVLDLHAENVVTGISRSTPDLSLHAIDLEMAFGKVTDLQGTQLISSPNWNNENSIHSHAALDAPSFACGLYAEDWLVEVTEGKISPLQQPWQGVRWTFPHLVQNSDGSFGYAKNVCSFLRGFADQWSMLQMHAGEIGTHLMQSLHSVPMRVVYKPTRSYMAALFQRKLGRLPIDGIAFHPRSPVAIPLLPAEIRQLNQLDVPYFFRVLGEESNKSVHWIDGSKGKFAPAHGLPELELDPYWSVVERQKEPQRLVRAVVDIARSVAPDGPFDYHDADLGVRIIRTREDERFLIVLILGEKRDARLTCRVAPEGSVEYWID